MYQISKNKVKSVDKGNKCVIDFYRFTDRIDTKQIRFPTLIDLWMDKSIPISIDRLLRVNRHIITNIIDHWSYSVSVKKKKTTTTNKKTKTTITTTPTTTWTNNEDNCGFEQKFIPKTQMVMSCRLTSLLILGDPGADKWGEGKFKRAEKYIWNEEK